MKVSHYIFVIIILISNFVLSQTVFTVRTDKPTYEHGEDIVVNLTVINDGNTTWWGWGDPRWCTHIYLNGIEFDYRQIISDGETTYLPRTKTIYQWRITPREVGMPNITGKQKLTGLISYMFLGFKDSTEFTAPMFKGGRIYFRKNPSVPESKIDSLRETIKAKVIIGSFPNSPLWEFENQSIDSLVGIYSKDVRFLEFRAYREISMLKEIRTNIKEESISASFSVNQNYPNPFNPTTSINYSLDRPNYTTLLIYDNLGRLIKKEIDAYQTSGKYGFQINMSEYPSGIYYYKLVSGRNRVVKKMLLLK